MTAKSIVDDLKSRTDKLSSSVKRINRVILEVNHSADRAHPRQQTGNSKYRQVVNYDEPTSKYRPKTAINNASKYR